MIRLVFPWQALTVQTPWGVVVRAGFDQKRHPKGSSDGGQFARQDWALDTSVPPMVNDAMSRFQTYNRTRAQYNRAKRSGKDPAKTERLKKTLAMTKALFENAQRNALERGIRVNKLGKWTNQEVDQRLLKEAAEVRQNYLLIEESAIQMINRDPYLVRGREVKAELEAKREDLIARRGELDERARKMGLDPQDSGHWPISARDIRAEMADLMDESMDNTLALMNTREKLDKREKLIREDANKRQKALLLVDDPLPIKVMIRDDDFRKKYPKFEGSANHTARFLSAKVAPRTFRVQAFEGEGFRSYSLADEIHIAGYLADGHATVAHEFGHILDHSNHNIRYKANQFLKRRAGNEKPTPIQGAGVFTSYRSTEVGIKDNFIDHYMGKIYGSTDPDKMFRMANTEIVSKGLELLATDPTTLMTEDPEYFDFIYAIARGG